MPFEPLVLQSDHKGEQSNYLTWSMLGILMREGRIDKGASASTRGSRYRYVKLGTAWSKAKPIRKGPHGVVLLQVAGLSQSFRWEGDLDRLR
jgi:hypothetical protein